LGAVFVGGVMTFGGVAVGADFNFGLIDLDFNFIGNDHFNDDFFRLRDRPFRYDISRVSVHTFFSRTVVINNFHRDADGRMVNEGLGRERIAALTHRPVEVVHAEERAPVGDRARLPEVARGAPAARGAAVEARGPESAARGAPAARGPAPVVDHRVFAPPPPRPQAAVRAPEPAEAPKDGKRGP
jgi:hypothetical protein